MWEKIILNFEFVLRAFILYNKLGFRKTPKEDPFLYRLLAFFVLICSFSISVMDPVGISAASGQLGFHPRPVTEAGLRPLEPLQPLDGKQPLERLSASTVVEVAASILQVNNFIFAYY